MKLAFLPLILALAASAEERDLFLVAGQSNAVGFDARPSQLPAGPADKEVLFWWRCGDPPPDRHDSNTRGEWTHLQPQPLGDPVRPKNSRERQYGNFAQPDGGFGPEIGFARALHAAEKKPFAIVKAAFSGTSLAVDWNPADAQSEKSCYRALVAETKAAIVAAKDRGIDLRIRALIWMQGESDASQADAPRYAERLGGMLAALRKDLASPQLIALLAVNTRFGNGRNTFIPVIIDQQKALAAKDSCCAYVDTSAASIANEYHFDSAGTLEAGRLLAEALMRFEKAAASSPVGR